MGERGSMPIGKGGGKSVRSPRQGNRDRGMTPAMAARLSAGLGCAAAARKLRISESYLRQCERYGPTLLVMEKMAGLYQCRVDDLVTLREGVVWYRPKNP